ncbi:MAG: hypothetical protein QXI27_04735 [Nitrososphaerota archaeon]
MPRAPILRNKVIDLLRDGPKSWEELKKLTGVKGGSLDFALKELVRRGIVKKGDDGRWRLIWSGYINFVIGEKVKEFFEKSPRSVMEYAMIFISSINSNEESYYLEHKLSSLFLESAENFLMNAYTRYSAWLVDLMSEDERRRFMEAIRGVALVGCSKLGLSIAKEMERFKNANDKDAYFRLSDCVLVGLQSLKKDLRISPLFLATLWDLGILGLLAKEVLEELGLDVDHKEAERRALESIDLVEDFLSKLENLELLGMIYLTPEFYREKVGLIWRFERWLKNLREGHLDHREYLLDSAGLALKFADAVKSGIINRRLMKLKLDGHELWTLGDLYWHHPRGRDPSFYKEIYVELEKMRKRIAKRNADGEKVILQSSPNNEKVL